jgi:hypothetical protein
LLLAYFRIHCHLHQGSAIIETLFGVRGCFVFHAGGTYMLWVGCLDL